jgi:hypothetical protein
VFLMDKGKTLNVGAPGLLPALPRSEENAPARSIALDGAAAHGKATIDADGGFSYAPAKGFTGTDTFRFTITSGTATTPGTVTIVVR